MLKLPPKNKIPFATFSKLTRMAIVTRDSNQCKCRCEKCERILFLSIHHLISNTKANRKIYGNLLQNKSNGVMLCQVCHGGCVSRYKDVRNEVRAVFDEMIKQDSNIIYADQLTIDIELNRYKRVV